MSGVGRPDPAAQFRFELRAEGAVGQDAPHTRFQAIERRDQRLRYVAPAVRAETAARIGECPAQHLGEQPIAIDAGRIRAQCLSSSAVNAATRAPRGVDEIADPRRVLHSARPLHPGAHVHPERPYGANGFGDIACVETTGQHQLAA